MKLIDVRQHKRAVPILYTLLKERDPAANISHKRMPTKAQHNAFVANYGEPYAFWGIIEVNDLSVGAIYLTKRDEIGIAILERYQGKGYGPDAIRLLMRMFGDRDYLANIAPGNTRSQEMFTRMGFEICQHTYRREVSGDAGR